MRVAYIHPFSQHVSGPDESLLAMLPFLMKQGVEAHLVVPRVGPSTARYRSLGVIVHVLPLCVLNRAIRAEDAALFPGRALLSSARVTKLLRQIGVDLVHTNMEVVLEGGLAARVLKVPHVLHYRGNSLDSPRYVFDVLTWIWSTFSDQVFCISEATASVFRSRRRIKKLEVLYNPVDVPAFHRTGRSTAVRESLRAMDDDLLVITMGRIHPRKDLATFIRAAAHVVQSCPSARFAIVGVAETEDEHRYKVELESLVATLALTDRVFFAGHRNDVPAVMKAADVFVLSSRHEGFGRVLAEAMAAGTAAVATREGALPELLNEPACGLGAAPGDAEEFAAQIVSFLTDPVRRSTVGQAAATRARQFDAEKVANRVFECYGQLIMRRGSRNSS